MTITVFFFSDHQSEQQIGFAVVETKPKSNEKKSSISDGFFYDDRTNLAKLVNLQQNNPLNIDIVIVNYVIEWGALQS